MTTFVPGRLPNDPGKPRLALANHLDVAGVDAPAFVDNISRAGVYPMDGNDRYGDCTCAEVAHHIQSVGYYGGGGLRIVPSRFDVLKAYSAITGFSASDPSTDNGAVMQDVQNYWRKTGLAGHKSLAFAEVDVKKPDQAKAAIYLFGAISVGLNFPASAMDQFDADQPWDVVPHSPDQGGHAIHVAGYDSARKVWSLTTWGKVIEMTDAFWSTYIEEAWVPILPEWEDAHGVSPTGLDLAGLGTAFSTLTGQPDPFPNVLPPPPPPKPPVADGADAALIDALADWARHRHFGLNGDAVSAFRLWKAAKGY